MPAAGYAYAPVDSWRWGW